MSISLHLKISVISGMSNCTFSSLVTLIHSHCLCSILCPAVRVTLENANLITSLFKNLQGLPCLSGKKSKVSMFTRPHKAWWDQPPPHSPSLSWSSFALPSSWPLSILQYASSSLLQGLRTYCSFPLLLPQFHWPITKVYQTAEMSFPWRNLSFTMVPLAVPYNICHNHNYVHA